MNGGIGFFDGGIKLGVTHFFKKRQDGGPEGRAHAFEVAGKGVCVETAYLPEGKKQYRPRQYNGYQDVSAQKLEEKDLFISPDNTIKTCQNSILFFFT